MLSFSEIVCRYENDTQIAFLKSHFLLIRMQRNGCTFQYRHDLAGAWPGGEQMWNGRESAVGFSLRNHPRFWKVKMEMGNGIWKWKWKWKWGCEHVKMKMGNEWSSMSDFGATGPPLGIQIQRTYKGNTARFTLPRNRLYVKRKGNTTWFLKSYNVNGVEVESKDFSPKDSFDGRESWSSTCV